jgi:hypothetical protein
MFLPHALIELPPSTFLCTGAERPDSSYLSGEQTYFWFVQGPKKKHIFQEAMLPAVTLGGMALHSAWGVNPGFDWVSPAVSL